MTVDLTRALLAAARGAEPLAAVLDGPGAWDALPDETAALRAHLDEVRRDQEYREVARAAVSAAARGDEEAARTALVRLLREVPQTADDLLRAVAEPSPALLDAVARLTSDPALAERARFTLGWLAPDAGVDLIRVHLPASWFAATADPVHEHEIFLRLLPELRSSATVDVPAVRVSAAEELEPDGFVVERADGTVLRRGTVPADRRFCPDDAFRLCPGAEAVPWPGQPGWWSVDAGVAATRLGTLVTWSGPEAVLRVVHEEAGRRVAVPAQADVSTTRSHVEV